ncbi:MAG: hypothetical protein ACXV7D_07070, partial [Thermoanaerobaculia bacterium]
DNTELDVALLDEVHRVRFVTLCEEDLILLQIDQGSSDADSFEKRFRIKRARLSNAFRALRFWLRHGIKIAPVGSLSREPKLMSFFEQIPAAAIHSMPLIGGCHPGTGGADEILQHGHDDRDRESIAVAGPAARRGAFPAIQRLGLHDFRQPIA